jgi:hypothetical protein
MSKSGTLITAAVLAFGLASASMAADTPATGGDTTSTSAPKAKKHSAGHKHSAKKKSSTTAASTK